jgi:hypothetical protein
MVARIMRTLHGPGFFILGTKHKILEVAMGNDTAEKKLRNKSQIKIFMNKEGAYG